MVRINLTPTTARLVAVGLLVLLILAVFSFLILPTWQAYADNREAIADQRYQLARLQAISQRRPELLRLENDLRRRQGEIGHIMQERSAPLAAAALQERVKAVVENSGGSVSSARVLPAVAEGAFQRVTVSVRLSLSNEALQTVIYELEAAVPYLVINNVTINSRAARARNLRSRRRQPRRNNVAAQGKLDVTFDLSGFMRGAG